MDVVVVGCGVIGLSVSVRLAEAGHDVRMLGRELPPHTTSSLAAAVWYPYRADPPDRVLGWGRRTLEIFEQLAGHPGTGVHIRETVELFRAPAPDPWWSAAVTGLRRCTAAELPPGYRDGLHFTNPVIEMPVYLGYLSRRFLAAGGRIEQQTVTSLAQAVPGARVVVNCTGIGARELAGDPAVTPIRGQIVVVANPGLERVLIDDDDPRGITYIVPRSSDCVLGGSAEVGNTSLRPEPRTARDILSRCIELEPRLAGAAVLAHRVGLRPGRSEVRLDAERLPGGTPCVHNYGHGGAGVTLSWGCADDAVALVMATTG